jgi:hypothetical protein
MNSKEFKKWKKWFEKNYPEEFIAFNDEILYEFYLDHQKS